MSPMPERMSDHWWWRPGVRPGRRLLVWHILLDNDPQVRDLVLSCQSRLAGLEGLDLIPAEWLHMTTQIVGFVDEINSSEVEQMLAGTTKRLRFLTPTAAEIGKVLFASEGVVLGIRPQRALDPVRSAIREAIADTVGAHQLDDEPDWTPHVSVAYSHGDGLAAPIIDVLTPRPSLEPFTVREVHLVSQERANRLYRWEHLAAVPLGR